MGQIFGWKECMQTRLCLVVESYRKQDVFYLTGMNLVVRGHFHLRNIFFSWFLNAFCLLKGSENKMYFSQHFFLMISRHFTGSSLLSLAVSLHSAHITACLIFLRLQFYFLPMWGKHLSASQHVTILASLHVTNTICYNVLDIFFMLLFFFLCTSSQTETW